jgi:S-adenosylmethionine:tRNA-ribosyltransferase-isomerase (queuine synthetase)
MRIDEFDYDLPEELIAQEPVEPRDRAQVNGGRPYQKKHRAPPVL